MNVVCLDDLHQLSKLEFVVFLVLEQFADFEARQLATDVVLGLDGVEESQRDDGLFDECAEFEVVDEVHAPLPSSYIYHTHTLPSLMAKP